MAEINGVGNLVIRTGVVRSASVGYLFAADLQRQEDDEPHSVFFKRDGDKWVPGHTNFNVHSTCLIHWPEFGLLSMSASGDYLLQTAKGPKGANVFAKSTPKPAKPRYGDIRWVASIADKAYAVGHMGAVYRLDKLDQWARIDDGLPEDFDVECIAGFSDADLYAVGYAGQCWHFNGQAWSRCELETNAVLTRVCCAGDGQVYAGGHGGVLMVGRGQQWSVLANQEVTDDIWSVAWFEGALYVATMSELWRWDGKDWTRVNFGDDAPKTFYHLSCAPDAMWSVGEEDVMCLTQGKWHRVA
jgi:hypothetical protein